jgi:hypothetical protein
MAYNMYFRNTLERSEIYVWPDPEGNVRGQAIEPLSKSVIKAVKEDKLLYQLLSLIEVVRVGKTRELKIAINELRKTILNES